MKDHYRFADWTRYPNVTPDRWNGRVVFRAQHTDKLASVTLWRLPDLAEDEAVLRWARDTPYPGHEIYRTWRHIDRAGGSWSVEYGYDGRWWVLFGPDGTPFGSVTLATRVDEAIAAASMWPATIFSQLRRTRDTSPDLGRTPLHDRSTGR
jgi:hypothetical protein